MELTALRRGGRLDGPHVLITGGVHGDEFEPMVAIRRLAEALADRVIRGRVTLVPVVNEPAFRLAGRTGIDGLDLARVCPGRPDGSATEQIAHALATLIRSADAYIDLHSGGSRLLVFPMAGYMLHPHHPVLDRQRRMARWFGLPVVWGTDASLEGRSLSVARDANVPAIYAEYLGGGRCDPRGVSAYVRGCLNVLADLRVIDVDESIESVAFSPLVVEDPRPGSGHMQVEHPSPASGIFEPAAMLGRPLRKGDLLGTVLDPLGDAITPITAGRSGLLLVLRSLARVTAGESLGVVLETDQAPPEWPWQSAGAPGGAPHPNPLPEGEGTGL